MSLLQAGTNAEGVHRSYRHGAYLYRSSQEFIEGMAPFVRDGVEAGQPVLVALVPERWGPLRDALGPAADEVLYADLSDLGSNPARILPAWRDSAQEHSGPGRPVRGIGDPVGHARREAEVAECQLHEALLNVAIEPDIPLWLRCPYDVSALPAAAVAEAERSHPALALPDSFLGSRSYAGAPHGEALFRGPLPEPATPTAPMIFGPGDVGVVRRTVSAHARLAGLSEAAAAGLELAMAEVAANSVHYGGGRGELRMWREPGALVCEVGDHGYIEDTLIGRGRPAPFGEGGRGVWLANQLCDLVQVRSGDEGTTVRIWSWL